MNSNEIIVAEQIMSDYYSAHKYREVIEISKKYADEDITCAFVTGRAYIELGQYQKGRECLKNILPHSVSAVEVFLTSYFDESPEDYQNNEEMKGYLKHYLSLNYAFAYYFQAAILLKDKKFKEAFELLKKALNKNLVGKTGSCYFLLAGMYKHGRGVAKNSYTASKYYIFADKKGCSNGLYDACLILLKKAEKDSSIIPQILKLLCKRIDKGDARCMMLLGNILLSDKYGMFNEEYGYYWHEQAAKRDRPESLLVLAKRSLANNEYDVASKYITSCIQNAKSLNVQEQEELKKSIGALMDQYPKGWFWRSVDYSLKQSNSEKGEIQA